MGAPQGVACGPGSGRTPYEDNMLGLLSTPNPILTQLIRSDLADAAR